MIALSMYCFEHVVSPFKSKADSCLHETGQMAPTGDETKSVRRAIRFGLGKQKTAACPPSFPSSLSPASGRWACQHSSARGRPRDRLADASCWRRTSYAWRKHTTEGTLPRHSTASGLRATAGVAVNICPLSAVKKQIFAGQ